MSNKKTEEENTNQSERKLADVADMGNYKYYKFHGCLLSEPKKYFGTHLMLMAGMLIYYICTAKYQHPLPIVLTVLLHISVLAVMFVLAFKDPGIIPKILPNF